MNGSEGRVQMVLRWLGSVTLADVVTWGVASAIILYIALVMLGFITIGGLHEDY